VSPEWTKRWKRARLFRGDFGLPIGKSQLAGEQAEKKTKKDSPETGMDGMRSPSIFSRAMAIPR
jgi:hypothetical protein